MVWLLVKGAFNNFSWATLVVSGAKWQAVTFTISCCNANFLIKRKKWFEYSLYINKINQTKEILNGNHINDVNFSERRSLQQLELGYFSSKWGEVAGCHIYDISL